MKPEEIVKLVADYYGIGLNDLIGRSRVKTMLKKRAVAMYVLKNTQSISLQDIGIIFSGRDHTTVMNSLSLINNTTFPGIEEEACLLVSKIIDKNHSDFFIHQTMLKPKYIELKYCDNQDLYGLFKMEIV